MKASEARELAEQNSTIAQITVETYYNIKHAKIGRWYII